MIGDLSLLRRGLLTDGMAEKSAKVHEIELAAARIIRTVRKIATDLRPGEGTVVRVTLPMKEGG